MGFSGRFSFTSSTRLALEGPASARTGEALVVAASLASSILSLETSVVAEAGNLVDYKTASKTLAILLFLGVVVAVVDSFSNPVAIGGLNSFDYSSAVFFVPALLPDRH